ncbi:hypothetical protein, partial [Phascolarctobacterium succinatutens]|uniref:hypothetical protein n=1 Tax=Phascolarctobacterium succinatutens TaxID=626940 RepID=UPI0034C6714C
VYPSVTPPSCGIFSETEFITSEGNRLPLWKHHKNILTYIKKSVQRTSCEGLALYAFGFAGKICYNKAIFCYERSDIDDGQQAAPGSEKLCAELDRQGI